MYQVSSLSRGKGYAATKQIEAFADIQEIPHSLKIEIVDSGVNLGHSVEILEIKTTKLS